MSPTFTKAARGPTIECTRAWTSGGRRGVMPGKRFEHAFTEVTEGHRRELLVHCYQMLGSVQEAEDLVQETMLRAWRAYDGYDPELASMRTWLYRIATNACLNALESRSRRPLPSGVGQRFDDTDAAFVPGLEVPWLQPIPDRLLGAEPDDPAMLVAERSGLRLAVVAALQLLPAKQRAVLILREVLDFAAAEVAVMLGMSTAAVNSALQRARATFAGPAFDPETLKEPEAERRAVVDRYMAAFERADVAELARMLAEEVVLEMPPMWNWYMGITDYARFMARVFDMRGLIGGRGRSGRTCSRQCWPTAAKASTTPCTACRSSGWRVVSSCGPLCIRILRYSTSLTFQRFCSDRDEFRRSGRYISPFRSPGPGQHEEQIMYRTIIIAFSTVDGVTEDPDGRDGTPNGGWAFRHGPEVVAGDKFKLGPIFETGVLLLGRRTWQQFSRLWPRRTDDFSAAMNRIPKLVASHNEIDLSAWENSSLLAGDLFEAIAKQKTVRDVVVIGSASVAHALAERDLVDEYRVLVFPDLVGRGTKLFTAETTPSRLRQVSVEATGPAFLVRYERELL